METKYYVVGERPVKSVREKDGSFGIYAFNWETGVFDLNLNYLERIVFGDESAETEEVNEEYFETYVQKLKSERGLS